MRELPVIQGPEPHKTPIFARIGIVGLGLIGGSIALAARRSWPSGLVVGIDRKEVLEDAQRAHAIDVAADDLGMLAEVDLVVLAAPVLSNLSLLPRLPQVISRPVIVTDVGSTKQQMVDAARALPPNFTFIGGHPLAGAPHAGILSASPDLLKKRPWILTPGDGVDRGSQNRIEDFVRALGSVPHIMSPAEHDRVIGWMSHLPQLVASTLMRVVGEEVGEDGLALAGRSLREMTRLASSPAHVWADVCRTNEANIAGSLDRLIRELERLRDGLSDAAVVDEVFGEAAGWRKRLPD